MKLTALASLVFCGLGVLAWPDQALAETAARARRPVTHEVLARVDASTAPAGFALLTHSRTAGNYEAGGMALGPRLGVNVGYGVSRLVRLGFGAGADFALDLATTQNIPFTDIDGWMRWFAGPTVGFRWGPRVPLELEVHLAFTHQMPIGSQAVPGIDEGQASAYDLGSQMFGLKNGAILYYRPYGARSPFAVHGGVSYGWAFSGNSRQNANLLIGQLLLGVSVGL
jgi:hypothetical protein